MFRSPLGDGLIVLVILILFFGPKRLPMLSRAIGESIREFKGGIGARGEDEDQAQLPAESQVDHPRASSPTPPAGPQPQASGPTSGAGPQPGV